MEFITVFTPAYNRCNLLKRVYKSLKRQTDKDFRWMVIDDGSTDGTGKYIASLMKKTNDFQIEYYYKPNGGLHTAYNEAIRHLQTELCMCCDSDDWLPDNCIEKIRKTWKKKGRKHLAGVIGLDCDASGKIIGRRLPDKSVIDLNELCIRGKLHGDKKIAVRSELYQSIPPMKTCQGEKNFNPNYYNVAVSEHYKWIVLNENLCYVEYQKDGMSSRIYKQYADSPNSFMELRRLYLGLRKATFLFKCRHIIHYDAECLLAGRRKEIFGSASPDRVLCTLFYPAGLVYYAYIRSRCRKF